MMYRIKDIKQYVIKCYTDSCCSEDNVCYIDKEYTTGNIPYFTSVLDRAKIYKNYKRAKNVSKDIETFFSNCIGGVYKAEVIQIKVMIKNND